MASPFTRRTAVKIGQLGVLTTVVIAFAAPAAPIMTGQTALRDDPGVLGVRLAVVEHHADALDTRAGTVERRTVELPAGADAPAADSEPPVAPARSPGAPRTVLPR